jgi:hypothetical protein
MNTILEIVDLDDGTGHVCSLAAFLRDNEDCVDLCADVRALAPGESIDVGGGAAPSTRITRLVSIVCDICERERSVDEMSDRFPGIGLSEAFACEACIAEHSTEIGVAL